ncbi:hypothetical protein JOF56_006273 [Kibdelosporangium banguiense]|uniref:Glycosyltransferase RgtA/B/C/D-like domain-containing protein n=1 Tax=Kibdelosporangium banguiense TaxID=1365924 RepID=A0ABS4TNA1_9PSEU|nr:hypothetical protein [Kibdelosporangium banguiense]MBP2325888.1 hypothetical protein [Kibdelosporangium banguiense]
MTVPDDLEVVEPAREPRRWVLPAIVMVLSAGVFAVVRPHLIDDTFITLSYARNLAFSGHWGLIELGTSNTATSPLNVLLLAAITFVVRDAVLAAGILYVLCQAGIALALRRVGERAGLPSWFSPLAVVLLAVNPLLISSIGLEVQLGAAGLAWLLVAATERRPVLFGVITGLLTLVRVDLVLVATVVLLLRKRFWVDIWKSAAAALAVAVPWFAFSWIALGSAVADTLIIKTLQRSWGPWNFKNGPVLYEGAFLWATRLSFLPAVLGAAAFTGLLIMLVRRVRTPALMPFVALVPASIVHYLAYSRLHVPPYHWYYGPSIVAATIFLAAAVAAVAGDAPVFVRRAGGIPAVLVAGVLVVLSVGNYAAAGLPRQYAPITSNHASSAQYAQIGTELGRLVGTSTVRSAGEIGVLAYSCGCSIVDLFADRGAIGPAIAARKSQTGLLGRKLIDLNFHFFDYGVPQVRPEYALTEIRPDAPAPPDVIAQWPITSPWSGPQTLYLTRAD